jgi:hypothetical protein
MKYRIRRLWNGGIIHSEDIIELEPIDEPKCRQCANPLEKGICTCDEPKEEMCECGATKEECNWGMEKEETLVSIDKVLEVVKYLPMTSYGDGLWVREDDLVKALEQLKERNEN